MEISKADLIRLTTGRTPEEHADHLIGAKKPKPMLTIEALTKADVESTLMHQGWRPRINRFTIHDFDMAATGETDTSVYTQVQYKNDFVFVPVASETTIDITPVRPAIEAPQKGGG